MTKKRTWLSCALRWGSGLLGAVSLWAGDPGVYPRENREAARAWYLRWWPQGHTWSVGFTGDLATLRAGDTSAAWKQATETRVNLFRRVAGLSPVQLKDEYNRLSQAGALILGAKGENSHAPPSNWPGWTPEGFEGCQQSEISFRYDLECPVQVLMHDFGVESLGHRQHLLTPGLRWIGVGAAPKLRADGHVLGEAVLIHTGDPSYGERDPAFREPLVCWPAAGYLPKALLPAQWTIDVADLSLVGETELDLRDATATVTRNGVTLPALAKADPSGTRLFIYPSGEKNRWEGSAPERGALAPLIYPIPAVGPDPGYGEVTGVALTEEDPFGDVEYRVAVRGVRVRRDGSLWRGDGNFGYEIHAFDHQRGAPLAGQARLVNLSTRAPVRSGVGVTVGGFVVAGTRPKSFLLRAAGPALAGFGVAGVLPDPRLTVHRLAGNGAAALMAENDNWSAGLPSTAPLRLLTPAVGAFPWSEGSLDAALLVTLVPGNYSATVSGVGAGVGNGLVEIYDAEPDQTETHLANLSARTYVGAGGSDVQIAGFVLRGDLPRTVLLRATGRDLVPFGITDPVPQLRMDLYDGQNFVARADSVVGIGVEQRENLSDYENGSAWARRREAESMVGAFPSALGNYAVAMVRTLLPDRLYAVVVQSSTAREAQAGHALVEVYEMP